jgi:hypothetical protein
MRRILADAASGALRGFSASMVLTAFEPVERALLGRPPVYAPAAMVRRLIRGGPYGIQGVVYVRASGLVLRSLYGASIGALFAATRQRWPASGFGRTALMAGAIWAFELVALPASGATPPLRNWRRSEIALLLGHTFVFATALGWLLDSDR